MSATALVEQTLMTYWRTAPENRLFSFGEEKAWEAPHYAVARGDDPLFSMIKEAVGPFLWTPHEAFSQAFPALSVPAEALRVVSYVLPQTSLTRQEQRQATSLPAERWARSRFHGEAFNVALRSCLAKTLTDAGYPAVAPERLPDFNYRQSSRFGIASNWSERHVAFVAGHGTFGLSDGLITRWGKAVRFGSVVAHIDLPVTPRSYGDHHQAWCLWYAKGTCGACVRRCPVQAISTERGHDKDACCAYIRTTTAPYVQTAFGTGATPCGLCQVAIPCESSVPRGVLPPEAAAP